MSRYIFIALLVAGARCGVVWAVHPFLSPPQGLMPSNWTEAQLIQDRYPFHLIAPTSVSDEPHWIFAETFARLGAVLIGITCIVVFIRFRRHEKPTTSYITCCL
jgi:hypothetical protein